MNTVMPIGTHSLKNILKVIFIGEWIESLLLVIFLIVGILVSKKISKKTYKVNIVFYSIVVMTYIVLNILKGFKMFNMPPHNLLKDFCTVTYDIAIFAFVTIVPFFYTILILAKWGDKYFNEKKQKIKENKNEL